MSPDLPQSIMYNHFASVFTTDNGVFPVFHVKDSCHQEYQQADLTHYKVFCALKRLPSKSRTPGGFPAGFLKSIAYAIAFPLSRLFTMSMDCECIPRSWKQATVCPIFKKGSRKLPSKYYPVSLTSACLLQSNGSIVYDSMIPV